MQRIYHGFAENYCCAHLNAQNVTAAEYLASTNERMPPADACENDGGLK